MKTYYDILEIDNSADEESIKKAFKILALKYHPDKNSEYEDLFKNINEAYSVLSNKEKREKYDETLKTSYMTERWNDIFGKVNVSDLFNKKTAETEKKGSDSIYNLTLSLHEYIFGTTKTIQYFYTSKCPMCEGTGYGSFIKCTTCNGIGKVKKYDAESKEIKVIKCASCKGKGIIRSKCSYCNGNGYVKSHKNINVTISPDRKNDEIIMNGLGNFESGCTINGNLIINIKVEKDKKFKKIDNDLLINYEIYVVDLILGKNIIVQSPYGDESLFVPPGTQPDEKIRIKGKGIRGGDLIVVMKGIVPMSISDNERELYEKVRNESFIFDDKK